jgi:hypothetical protein
MATTVRELLQRVALDLQEEDENFGAGVWTQQEMIEYVTHAERDFLRQTGIIKEDDTVVLPGGSSPLVTKTAQMGDIERLSFDRKRLRRVTSWDLEREDPDWRSNTVGHPRYYHEDHLPIVQWEFDKIPAAGGTYRVFYDLIPDEHSHDLNELIAVADPWEPYIRWEVIALALARDGDNQDLARAAYAHARYIVGVQLAKRLIYGTPVTDFPGA